MEKILLVLSAMLLTAACGTSGQALRISGSAEDEYVDIGYGKARKSTSTAAVSTLEVPQGSGYSNIYDYIKGRVPGVLVIGNTIEIRGRNTIYGDTTPLYIVDGVEVPDIGYLSPDIVESITVLKDASSTAIYGARGANGVLLIKTRTTLE